MAIAQATPGPAQPSQIQRQFRPLPSVPTVAPEPQINIPRQTAPVGAERIKFTLATVRIDGVTVYRADALRPEYADLIGQQITFADLIDLANRLTARYRADGYILSQVVVPEQTIADGAVRLEAVEGFVDQVNVEGDIAGTRSIVDEFTAAISAVRPLTADALERNLLLLGDLPGVNVQSVLQPSPTVAGAANLNIVLRATPAEGFLSVDNRGSRFLGPWTLSVGGSEFSQLGRYEQIDALFASTPDDELHYGQLQATIQVGPPASGDTAQLFGSITSTRPSLPTSLFPFQTTGDDYEGRATYAHPVIRSRAQNLTLRGSFIWRDETVKIEDVAEDGRNPTHDRLRILQARATYDFVDPLLGVNLADIALNQGLNILGASGSSRHVSRQATGADAEFTYLSATLSRLQRIYGGFNVFGQLTGQYSGDALLPTERFGVGGAQFGRGFPPGDITGDSGLAGKVELQYGDRPEWTGLDSYQAYAFYDYGRIWDNDVPSQSTHRLSSLGAGLRLNVTTNISLNPEVAHDLTGRVQDTSSGQRETRLFITATGRF